MRSGWVVLTLAVAAMTLLSAAAHAEGVQAARAEAGAGVGGGDEDPSALIEADADLRQMQAEAQSEAHIVFVPTSDASADADADADADSEAESDVEFATEEAVDAEGEGEGEGESDADQEADSEAAADSDSEADSEGAEEADEVEAGTLLLSEEEQTAFTDAVMGAVDDASDAATEAEGESGEALTDAESAAATMRFASVRSQLAVRAQRSFEAVAKAAIQAAKHAAKVGDGEAESLSMAVAKQMGDSLLKTVGTGLAHKLGTSLAEKIGGWQQQINALSEQQSASEPGGAMRFATAKGSAKGRDPRWFPPPVPVHMTDSMRNEPADITAVAPAHRSDKTPEDVEDCVACRYVWLQVEQDVGNSAIEETVYDSFFQNALEAQKTPIFYPGCQTMFDQVDDMLGDYMDGYAVDQMCENAMLCR